MASTDLRPPKICMDASPLICPRSRYRGLGRYTLALVRGLLALPEPPDLVLFDGIREIETVATSDPDLAPLRDPRYDLTSYLGWFRFQSRLSLSYLRRKRPPGEVYLFPCADITPWRLPPGSAAIVHDLITACYQPWASKRKLGALRDRLHAWRVGTAELLLTNSQNTLLDACQVWGIPEEQVVAIPHLLLPLAAPSVSPSPRIREVQERDPGYLLFLGARDERKGIGPLLQLWEERHPRDARLVVAGPPGGEDPEVEKRLATLVRRGDVTLLVDLDEEEKADLLRGARALLFPSLYEGYGLPLAEAMLAGVPVVTFRNSSLPEVCGDAGVVLPDRDFQGLLDRGLELARDPEVREREVERVRSRASRFDQRKVAERFLSALASLVSESGS